MTDDFSYNIVKDGVHLRDLHATILHCMGLNHERLTYRFNGRDFRLTDVAGNVVREIIDSLGAGGREPSGDDSGLIARNSPHASRRMNSPQECRLPPRMHSI